MSSLSIAEIISIIAGIIMIIGFIKKSYNDIQNHKNMSNKIDEELLLFNRDNLCNLKKVTGIQQDSIDVDYIKQHYKRLKEDAFIKYPGLINNLKSIIDMDKKRRFFWYWFMFQLVIIILIIIFLFNIGNWF